MIVNDDTDLPVDGNACTDDVCTAGVPSNPNLSSGTTCGTNLMCNGQGACVGCITAANCGTDTDLPDAHLQRGRRLRRHQRRRRNAAARPEPDGAATASSVQCDGTGSVADRQRRHGQAGRRQRLHEGPVQRAASRRTRPRPRARRAARATARKCNGSGTAPACVQCLAPTDCPGTDTECHHRTCSAAGVCGISNTRGRHGGQRPDAARLQEEHLHERRGGGGQRRHRPAGRQQRLHDRPVHERRAVEHAAGRQRVLQRGRRHALQRRRPACVAVHAGQPLWHRHGLPDVHAAARPASASPPTSANGTPLARQPDGGRLQDEGLQRQRRRRSRGRRHRPPGRRQRLHVRHVQQRRHSAPVAPGERSVQPEQRNQVQRQRDGSRVRPVPREDRLRDGHCVQDVQLQPRAFAAPPTPTTARTSTTRPWATATRTSA